MRAAADVIWGEANRSIYFLPSLIAVYDCSAVMGSAQPSRSPPIFMKAMYSGAEKLASK